MAVLGVMPSANGQIWVEIDDAGPKCVGNMSPGLHHLLPRLELAKPGPRGRLGAASQQKAAGDGFPGPRPDADHEPPLDVR